MTVNSIALTIDEASEYTGIGHNTLRQLIAWKKIPTLYIGKRILIRREILERFIELNDGNDLRNKSSVVRAE
ncbi:MAG: helix-turn-helix domain-containing protein [Lachnospiraceae bacterium]|nr:helix-turn-helix domain-containing protein [Lachnospiraceae bacterium]